MACDPWFLLAPVHGCQVRSPIQQRVLVLSETSGSFLCTLLHLQLGYRMCSYPKAGCNSRCHILLCRASKYPLAHTATVSYPLPLTDRSVTLPSLVFHGCVRFSSGPAVVISNLPWTLCVVLASLHDHLHVSPRYALSANQASAGDRYICGYYAPQAPYIIYDCGTKDFITLF